MQLDHVVFNTRDRTDEIVEAFTHLGFQVSERGFHSLGSINHTIVLDGTYLELLGYPPGAPPPKRPELVNRPLGWMATVLATDDADRTRTALVAAGLAARPVQEFSRPVALPDGSQPEARFRVTRLEPDAVPGTWYYYCQHLTPELVWRREWQAHPNGAVGISCIDIEVEDLPLAARLHANAMECDLPVIVGHAFEVRADACTVRVRQGEASRMEGLTVAVRAIDAVKSHLLRRGMPFVETKDGLCVDPAALLGAKIQFKVQAR